MTDQEILELIVRDYNEARVEGEDEMTVEEMADILGMDS